MGLVGIELSMQCVDVFFHTVFIKYTMFSLRIAYTRWKALD